MRKNMEKIISRSTDKHRLSSEHQLVEQSAIYKMNLIRV